MTPIIIFVTPIISLSYKVSLSYTVSLSIDPQISSVSKNSSADDPTAGDIRNTTGNRKNTLVFPLEDDGEQANDSSDRIAHRSRSLASIASRSFFENEPLVACRACRLLAELAPTVHRAELTAEDLDMPWVRILAGANQCMAGEERENHDDLEAVVVGVMRIFPQEPHFQEVLDRNE